MKLLFAVVMLLVATVASAQVVVTQPSTDYHVMWTHSGLNVDHYEVRMSATAAWVGVGNVLQMTLPPLTAATYAAQVRACSVSTCSTASPALAFTVVPAIQTPIAPVTPTIEKIPLASSSLLFTSSWETALGCGLSLLDNGAWSDYGGSSACSGTVHDADVVNDIRKLGSNSLRITQKPGAVNGTDFRAIRMFGNQTEVTLIAWLRYDSAYHWGNGDHKIFLFLGSALDASGNYPPNVYINFRAGVDNTHPRLCAYSTPVDVFFCAASPNVTVNAWYRLRIHLVAGTHGKMEMWLQQENQTEQKLNLIYDAGVQANVNDLNIGQIGGVKLDTTYNDGGSITQNMFQYYDGIAVYAGLVN